MKREEYRYRHLPIPGGGFVTGIVYHPTQPDVLYLRTDIGGAYRWEAETQRWISLSWHLTPEDLSEAYPISIALDPRSPRRLYMACGVNQLGGGRLAVSEDMGEHFVYRTMPMFVHGNLSGRGTGERLLVDATVPGRLYFASQTEGFWRSNDEGEHWERQGQLPEECLTFVEQVGEILLVGSAGTTHKKGARERGHSLYVSYDHGVCFERLEQPECPHGEHQRLNGLVALRCAVDERYVYVTYSANGPNSFVDELGYACDSGDATSGCVVRYPRTAEGRLGKCEVITPESGVLDFGFCGVAVSRQQPGMVVVTTICHKCGDCIYRSYDYGASWVKVWHDLDVGRLDVRASYMKPQYNGNHAIVHWMSDIKINPFCSDEAWFNTGTGVFRVRNLRGEVSLVQDWCDGLEETVHLNIYGIPYGKSSALPKVVDIVGDLGGFAFFDLEHPCENSFADEQGNRYITCMNADFSEQFPQVMVVTPRGNWTGQTKGGVIRSEDGGRTFQRLPMPFGCSKALDERLHHIERPNVNSGWVALSADTQTIVWCVADGNDLPISQVVVMNGDGSKYELARVWNRDGIEQNTGSMKVFSDRLNSDYFYGFGEQGQVYVSQDGGHTFVEKSCETLPAFHMAQIDCENGCEIRAAYWTSGVFYLALGAHGLWKLEYDQRTDEIHAKRLSPPGESVYRVGMGVGQTRQSPKVLYWNGTADGIYGFYRSALDGTEVVRLNTAQQMFGNIMSMDGDREVYGRYYLATGTVGALYGEPEQGGIQGEI